MQSSTYDLGLKTIASVINSNTTKRIISLSKSFVDFSFTITS